MPQALVFYTDAIVLDDLHAALTQFGFIGAGHATHAYFAGKQFFEGLTFLGCSPQLRFSPEEDQPFCYVELFDQPQWLAGSNSRPPRCPHCEKPVADWLTVKQDFPTWQACPNCQKAVNITQWQSGKNAVYAPSGFMVWDVFENEAVASDALWQVLRNVSPVWQTMFYRS